MRLLKRVLLIVVIVILVLVLVGAGSGYWFVTKSHPQINGTLRVAGLKTQVDIVRDPMGVPHVYADNADDLFFAQGYVTAQDRLWNMEYNRRIGHATLSDIFGTATLDIDRFLRTVGLDRSARSDLAALTAEERQPLEAYARGVNAFINSHQDSLPIEFTILGFKPAPWEPLDTMVWGKVMAYQLSGQYEADLFRARVLQALGETKLKELMPPYPAEGPFVIPPEARDYKTSDQPITNYQLLITNLPIGNPDWNQIANLNSILGHDDGIGSNNWVIDGTKTTTGKPILANDPHLSIQMPSIWYESGLHCTPKSDACPYNVVGYTFPGVPGIVVGHNDRIAWGVTTPYADVADLYVEKINPQNPNQYEYQGKWVDMQVVEEPIKVKGVLSETLRIQITRHGPILTPQLPGVTQPLAFQWTGLREHTKLFESVLALNRAQNWNEFRAALKMWDAPSQNFVYGDVDGNIGYQLPGNIPIRTKGNGMYPADGSTGEYEWTSYIPFDELPSVFNPPTHFIASANNCIVPSTYKYWLSYDCEAPYREQRIGDLIRAKDKLSVDDVKAMQGDIYATPEAKLNPFIAAIKPEGFLQTRALEYVKTWDGRLTTDTVGGTINEVTIQRLLRNVFQNKLDKDLFNAYLSRSAYNRRVLVALLDQPNSDWWDDPSTPQKETRDDIVRKSYAEATDWLGSQFGDAPNEWRWERLHTATFGHPIGSVQPLNLLFNIGPVGVAGGESTIFRAGIKDTAPYAINTLSSMRMIVDLSNLGNSQQIYTTGQSGLPLDQHYGDMTNMWRSVQYAPMYFERAALDKVREGVLVLQP